MPGIRVVTVRAAQEATRHEQDDAKTWSIVARRRLVGMHITECAIGLVLERAFIRSVGREADMQVVTAARFEKVAELSHGAHSLRQIWPWKVRLMTSCCCSRVRRTKLTA